MKDLIVLSYKESEESILLHQVLKGKQDWSVRLCLLPLSHLRQKLCRQSVEHIPAIVLEKALCNGACLVPVLEWLSLEWAF